MVRGALGRRRRLHHVLVLGVGVLLGVQGPGIQSSQELGSQDSNVSAYAEAEEKSRLQ